MRILPFIILGIIFILFGFGALTFKFQSQRLATFEGDVSSPAHIFNEAGEQLDVSYNETYKSDILWYKIGGAGLIFAGLSLFYKGYKIKKSAIVAR